MTDLHPSTAPFAQLKKSSWFLSNLDEPPKSRIMPIGAPLSGVVTVKHGR